jgi:hypothetical protein
MPLPLLPTRPGFIRPVPLPIGAIFAQPIPRISLPVINPGILGKAIKGSLFSPISVFAGRL